MQYYLPYLNWIDHKTDQMKELLTLWANINTHSANFEGLQQFVEELKKRFVDLQGTIQEIELPSHVVIDEKGHKINVSLGKALSISKRANAPIQILLNGHMDTVFSKHSSFQKAHQTNPNTIVGPGVCDMKGGLVVLLYALQVLEKSPYASKIGWTVIITPDEEIGSPGSKNLLEAAAKKHHLGLIFEPAHSDGSLVTTRPGSTNLVIIVRGKSAHAGRDYTQGRSALAKACRLVLEIEALNTLMHGQEMPKETLGEHVIVNTGEFRSGNSFNIVPDLAIFRVNIRASEPHLLKEVRKKIDEIIAKNSDGLEVEVHEQSTRGPKSIDSKTDTLYRFVKECAIALDETLSMKASGGVSDGNTLAASGLSTIDSLGPIGGKMHTHEEYVDIDSIRKRTKLVSLVLMRIGNGEFEIESKIKPIEL